MSEPKTRGIHCGRDCSFLLPKSPACMRYYKTYNDNGFVGKNFTDLMREHNKPDIRRDHRCLNDFPLAEKE
jgi:hypothetical protein